MVKVSQQQLATSLAKVACCQVTLLSGRSCSQIFSLGAENVQDVLQQSADLLNMDPETVVRNGALMIGSTNIKDLKDCIPVHVRTHTHSSA